MSYFSIGEHEAANDYLTLYLARSNAQHVFEAMEIKFAIAERFRQGANKRLFGLRRAPKWVSGMEDALELYEEIAAALPHTDLAGRALYSKGLLMAQGGEIQSAIEAYEQFIEQYPTHRMGSDGYLALLNLYMEQAERQTDPEELLLRSRLALRQWKRAFPNDPRMEEGHELVERLEDRVASELLETACFFERTKRLKAARLYYRRLVDKFPQTASGEYAKERLNQLMVI
jgi:outer membrane protein assembly factor BamD (BamD/ComL family)